jgi:hypothetical protein
MNWQKTGTRATAADPSAMLLVFSGFGRLHFTMKFESDLFPDSSKLDSVDSLPTSMQFGVHWQKIRATLIRLKVLHSLSLVLLLLLMMVLLLLLLLLLVLLLLLLLMFWTQLPNLEMQPTFVTVGIVAADEGLDAWKRKC